MAKVETKYEEVEVEVKTISKRIEKQIVLTLSVDEAKALNTIIGRVGGNPDLTRRGLLDPIWCALNAAGCDGDSKDVSGTLYFANVSS